MKTLTLVALFTILLTGCATNSVRYDNSKGRTTVYSDPGATGAGAGIGIESQDIVGIADKMVRNMLRNRTLAGRKTPPRVVIDSEYFKNESTSRINRNVLTDRIRIQLNQASNGRMVFVGRHFLDMVTKERELKRSRTVDGGTIRKTKATAGIDYRLGGRITSIDRVNTKTSLTSRYTQISFEMIDMELGTIVWSGIYDFRKSGHNNEIYN